MALVRPADPFLSLRVAAVMGLAAASIGALVLVGYARHIGGWEPPVSGEVVARVGSRALLVAVEVILCLIFAVVAALGAAARDRAQAAAYAASAAVIKPLLTLGIMASAWRSGWYLILDPQGAHPSSLFLIMASAAQEVALIVAAVRLRPAEPALKTPERGAPTAHPRPPSDHQGSR